MRTVQPVQWIHLKCFTVSRICSATSVWCTIVRSTSFTPILQRSERKMPTTARRRRCCLGSLVGARGASASASTSGPRAASIPFDTHLGACRRRMPTADADGGCRRRMPTADADGGWLRVCARDPTSHRSVFGGTRSDQPPVPWGRPPWDVCFEGFGSERIGHSAGGTMFASLSIRA